MNLWRKEMNVKRISIVLAGLLALCLAAASQLSSASVNAYLVIEGTKQGKFKGSNPTAAGGRIAIMDFSFSVEPAREASSGKATGREASSPSVSEKTATPPQDKSSGMTTGRRQHGTITIVKEWDASSPQLMQAASTNELLTSVDIEFVHPGSKGPEVYKTIHMTNVMVSSIHQSSTGAAGAGKSETIVFTAETENIQMKSKDGNKMAMDDWMASK
jgi:type VI secretion system secreted protein Hcp